MKAQPLIPALLSLLSVCAIAETLDCRGILDPGKHDVRFQVNIDATQRTVRIVLGDKTQVMSPLMVEEDRYYFYDLIPGARDERIETRRMFRYERGPGQVFYADQDTGIFVYASCHTN